MCLWWVRMPSRDLTDVTLVSEDESCLLMKLVYLWKLYIDESCPLMKVVYWWKLSIDESYNSRKKCDVWRVTFRLWRCLLLLLLFITIIILGADYYQYSGPWSFSTGDGTLTPVRCCYYLAVHWKERKNHETLIENLLLKLDCCVFKVYFKGWYISYS